MLSLKGTIVTVDALNCQREIAQKIIDQGGDYALALKGNRPRCMIDVVRYFDDPARKTITAKPVVEADHGRIETRMATVSTDIEWLQDDPSVAWSRRYRQGGPHAQDQDQNHQRDRLLPARRGTVAGALQ